MEYTLTPGQERLLKEEVEWYHNWISGATRGEHPQWYAYSGAAGCGKTFMAKRFIEAIGLSDADYIGCAYTGKAVLQMQRNGLHAKTIHSLIYKCIYSYKEDPDTGAKVLVPEFVLRDELEYQYSLIIVDEAPMVNDEIVEELLSFGIPIIFMGDMNQLPPVFGVSTVMQKPNFILTQIMRQEENNPIVRLSQMVLQGIPLIAGQYGDSKVVREFPFDRSMLDDYDQILCTTNRMRYAINSYIRDEILHYPDTKPRLFEKVICRQNNWDIAVDGYPLTNGTSGYITDIDRSTRYKGYYKMDFHPDYFPEGRDFTGLRVDSRYIRGSAEDQRKSPRLYNEKFEYAYAITVHLSQGSEYDNVLFFDQFFHDRELTQKARYTAITRAKKAITIVSGNAYVDM